MALFNIYSHQGTARKIGENSEQDSPVLVLGDGLTLLRVDFQAQIIGEVVFHDTLAIFTYLLKPS